MTTLHFTTIKAARALLGVNALLSEKASNPKVIKGEKESGIHTAILHLAPGSLSGHNVCGNASPDCLKACLHTSGNPIYFEAKQAARIARTKALFAYQDIFLELLEREIMTRSRWAAARGLRLAVRLNGTSDIFWDRLAPDMMRRLTERGIIFYDYTKSPRQATASPFRSMVFSRSEVNQKHVLKMLAAGVSVAVVIAGCGIAAHPKPLPSTLWGYPTVDGDKHDRIFEHAPGSVILLRAKGEARGMQSGFIVDATGKPLGQPATLTIGKS